MSDDRARTSIHLRYVWIDPADPAPAELLGSLLPAFGAVGMTDCRFEVKTQGPPSINTSYDNFAAWLEALRENAPIREALCRGRLGADGSNVWLVLDANRGVFTLDYTGPVSEVGRLTAVIPSSPFDAQLRALPERDAFFDQSERFAAQESITPERMADAVSALRATAWLPRFEGHIEREGVRRVKRSLPEFLELLGGGMVHGEGGTHVGLSSEGLDVDVHAGPDGSVEIHVRAFDQGLGELLMATAREALALTAAPEGRVHLAGEVRTYSFRTPPDASWFYRAVELLRATKTSGRPDYRGHIKYLRSAETSAVTYHDPGELVRVVEESWSRVAEVRLNAWWWKALEVTLTCDVGREIVEMSVEAPSLEAARTKLAELAKALALDPQPQPFYTQKSSAEYDVQGWRNERFAAALRTTIEQFVGTRAVLNEGRIVNEDGSVDAFQEVDSLLRRVGNPRVFREVHIVADGPRGNALGLQLEPAEGRTVLRLRSTLTPDEFPQLTKALLRGLAVTKRAAGSTETARTNKDGGHLAKYLVPALAALLGFVLSPAFFTAASPKDTLTITFPVAEDDGTARLSDPRFRLEWTVQHEQWFRTSTNRSASASVRVFRGGEVIEQRENQEPGVVVSLPSPGSYLIEVVHRGTNVSDRLRLTVEG